MTNFNSKSGIVINGTDDEDFIYNEGADNVKIYLKAGNDQITNDAGNYVFMDVGAGDDTIINDENEKTHDGGDYATLIGGAGNDQLWSYADKSLIFGDEGNDFIICNDSSTVTGGTGKDTIMFTPSSMEPPSKILANKITDFNASEDILMFNYKHIFENSNTNKFTMTSIGNGVLLKNKYYEVTLIGQTLQEMQQATIAGFTGYSANKWIAEKMQLIDLLDSTGMTESHIINNTKNNVIVNGTNEADTITNTGSYVTINAYAGNDSIVTGYPFTSSDNWKINYVTVNAGEGNDTINAHNSNSIINGENGNDYISIGISPHYLTISGGADNDYIENRAADVSISGGSGNDTIRNFTAQQLYADSGTNVTINAGSGNDNIYLTDLTADFDKITEVVQYESGKDIIHNYSEEDKIKLLSGKIDKAELNGNDVVITISDGSITLKEAKGNQITVLDTNDKTINFTNTYESPENITDNQTTIFDEINKPENKNEKNEINNTSIGMLEIFSNFYKSSGLDWLVKNDVKLFDTLKKDANPLLKFIADIYKLKNLNSKGTSVNAYLNLIASGLEIIDATVNLINDIADNNKKLDDEKKTSADFTNDVLQIISNMTIFANNLEKFNGKSPILLPIVAAGVGVVGNYIATVDNVKLDYSELKKIEKSRVKLATAIVTNGISSTLSETEKNNLIAPFGPMAVLTSVLTGIVSGYWTYQESIDKYEDDGLPSSLAFKAAITDAIVTVVHDSLNTYTKGIDDFIFDVIIKGLIDVFSDSGLKEGLKDKNYVEILGDVLKHIDFSEVGSRKDDDIVSIKDNDKPIYSDDGNDKILIEHSNLEIYSGRGNDTVFSIDNTHNNYVYAGNGNDYLAAAGKNHTIHGGNGDDRILVQGIEATTVNGHYIYGDAGNDYIILSRNATNNVIRGGLGEDAINLALSKNNIIIYSKGDSLDTIYCYEESNKIRIQSDEDFSTLTSADSDDVTVKVGEDNAMIIIDGKGKNLDITMVDKTLQDDKIVAIENENFRIDSVQLRSNIYVSSDGKVTDSKRNTSIAQIEQSENAVIYSALKSSDQELRFGSTEDEKDWLVTTSTGNDSIISSAVSDSTINSGAGNDTIQVGSFGSTSVNSGLGNDYIEVTGLGKSTINAGKGNDTINAGLLKFNAAYMEKNDVEIQSNNNDTRGSVIFQYASGDGNDVIQGYKTNDTIQITNGSYSTQNSGDDVIIKVGTGAITLKNAKGKNINIQDNIPNDDINYIKNTEPNTIISGTNGRDSVDNGVYVYGSSYNSLNAKMTINTFDGDDTINNYADNVSINAGSGNDYINNLRSYPTVIAGSGNDTIYNYGQRGNINGGEGNDSIVSYYFSYVTIDGGSGDDSIYSGGQDASILGGFGNDKITISGKWSTVIAGEDNDTISNISYYSFINAGSGNDSVNSVGDNVTIQGSSGNDSITKSAGSNNNLIQYTSGDGNDVIYGYNITDTIQITRGTYSTQNSGNDIVVKIDYGSITIKDAKNKTLNIIGKMIDNKSDTLPTGLIYNKNKTSITANKKFMGTEINLNNYASTVVTLNSNSVKKAQNIVGNDNNNVIKGGKGADTLDGGLGNDTLTGGKGKNTFIYDGCGTDVITDYKVGDTIKTYSAVTASALNKKDLTLTTADGGSILIKKGKGKKVTVNELTLMYGDNTATMFASNNDTIDAKNYSMVAAIDGSKTKKSINITAGNDGNLLKGGTAKDTLISGTGNDTLIGGKGNDVFVYNGGDDIITDYSAGQDTIMISSDLTVTASTLKSKDVILTLGNQTSDSVGSLTLRKGKGKAVKIVKSLDDISLPVIYGNGDATVSIATSDVSIISDISDNVNASSLVSAINASKSSKGKVIHCSDTKSVRIAGGKKADTISGNSGNDTIYGNAGNDSIIGYYGNDLLNGGTGNDTIIGFNGNNTLVGGKGKDVFVYSGDSNDTITDYTAGQDKIYLNAGVVFKSATYDGKNLIFTTTADKTLTLQNAINKKNIKQKITIVDNGVATSQVYGESTITVANADCTTLDATTSINSGLTSIDASKRSAKNPIYVIGNNNDITLKGGKGNDTLLGGSGSDIFDSGKGNDVIQLATKHTKATIIYTGGNDTVSNFASADVISLSSGVTAVTNKISDTEYDLTLKKGKTKLGSLHVVGNSTFNIDDAISGGIKAAYVEHFDSVNLQPDFLEDNLLEEKNSGLDFILDSSSFTISYNLESVTIPQHCSKTLDSVQMPTSLVLSKLK